MNRRCVIPLALAAAALAPATAAAYYGNGASIVSADLVRLEQGDDSTLFADIAADGRYVAFQTRARNFFADDDPDPAGRYRQGGVFRRDLATGARLALVASGDQRDEQTNDVVARGAGNPSVSADGRYVAFATGERLAPVDTNGNVDVYVRDMALAPSDAGAYDLVSARDGGDVPATYAARPQPAPGRDPGSEITRASAISDDGRYVVFRTAATSDLPAAAPDSTPSGQLLVRDRQADTTTLVTRRTDDGNPAGGALGGVISGDGSTVAWTGANAALQTRFLEGETQSNFPYYLWRRVADGPAAPTRRITGAVDPDDPACPPGAAVTLSPTAQGPCYGPLTGSENVLGSDISSYVPELSADGRVAVFITGAGPRPNASTPEGLDLWVTQMDPGVTRKTGSTELTRQSTQSDPPVDSISVSGDGSYVAMTTLRNRFVFPALTPVGDFRATADRRELLVADLVEGTIERGLRAYTGGDTLSGVEPGTTITDDGTVAFTSSSGDLFFGDGNNRADAFVVDRQPEPAAEAPQPLPPSGVADTEVVERPAAPRPRLSAKAKVRSGGVLEITVFAPAAGVIKATAKGSVGSGRKRRTVVLSTVSARARKRGSIRLKLKPVKRYRAELKKRKKIRTSIALQFVPTLGNKRVSGSIRSTFTQKVPQKKRKR